MDNLSWSGQPLKQFLGESRNSEDVIQVRKGLVQAEKHVKVAELRQQLERLIQRQNVEYDRTFNAEILKPPLSSELAAKLFHKLGEVGMVLYGYIHHKEGLEIEVLALDEEILAVFIDAMDKFLKAQRECRNKSIRGIDLWLEDRILNACSDVLPEDLRDDKNRQKAIQNKKRSLKRKERHGSETGDLGSFDGDPGRIQEDQNLQPAWQPNTTRPHQNTIIQQHPSNINSTLSYQSPYLPRSA